ncbi:MAG: DUF5063 domain-containing protein [Hymenobacter sp.]|nr:MAG: DUF5063 domain-containing protein [Hymenobacter sp.]
MKTLLLAEVLSTEKFWDFISIACQYCLLIESRQPVVSEEFIKEIQKSLLGLYSAALLLDWVDLQTNVEPEVRQINLPLILRAIEEKLATYRYYWSVFNPTDMNDTEPSCDDLHDDLGDIYKDLKYSLLVFDLQTADSQETAVFEFKFDFENHWGSHCINALRALHFFIKEAA